jgi:hypothetical protein
VRATRTHELKTHPPYFGAVLSGAKRFEIRVNDRDYQVGDLVLLREWDPEAGAYTGAVLRRRISYVTEAEGLGLLREGVVVFGMEME